MRSVYIYGSVDILLDYFFTFLESLSNLTFSITLSASLFAVYLILGFVGLEMKKFSIRNDKKSQTAKQFNMKMQQGDHEKIKSEGLPDSDCMMNYQIQYIENLQQQISALENEIEYLSNMLERNKQHPSIMAEGERMMKKIADYQNEIKCMKVDFKRKQTTIDLLRSEKDRFQKYLEDIEEKYRISKGKLLEEVITLQKEKDAFQDANTKAEKLVEELKQENKSLQEDYDNLEVEVQQLEREKAQCKETISDLLEKKEALQKELFESCMSLEAKSSTSSEEATKELKSKMADLYEEMEVLKRSQAHESLLRERLSEDNSTLIRRHADTEAELAEVRANLREEQSKLSSLEQVHLKTVLEASETKSRDHILKDEIEQLKGFLKEECERSYNLSHQLTDEQRSKAREEENVYHLQERCDQKEEKMKLLKSDNIALSRDNTYLTDQVVHLKQLIQAKDQEIFNLKQKVQEMQVSVEEFIQTNQAAARLAGERWKQLGQLAKSIQALTNVEAGDC